MSYVTGKETKLGALPMSKPEQRHHCVNQGPQNNPFNGLTKNILAENFFFACFSLHSGWWWVKDGREVMGGS